MRNERGRGIERSERGRSALRRALRRALRGVALASVSAGWFAAAAQEAPPAGQEAPAAPAAPIRANVALSGALLEALDATLAAKSYAFRCTSENRGGGGERGGAGGGAAGGGERGGAAGGGAAGGGERGGAAGGGERGGARDSREPVTVEGHWQAGSPTELKNGALAGFRLDDQLIYRRGDGAAASWERFDENEAISRRPGGGTAGGGSAGGGTAGGGTAGGGATGGTMAAGGIPMTGFMMQRNLMQLAGTRPPHELLARLKAAGCATLEEVEVEGKKVWRATLDPRLADEFAGVDRLRRMAAQTGRGGGGGGGSNDLAVTVELTIAEGRIESLTIATLVKTRRGESTRLTRYALSDFGAGNYEVPKAVLDLLAT
ncbi:MAG: hypothetical protein JNL90_18370 [Planctomycetes bacterium]|nr:hypothetical protein [Planctomycetota bacterium]